MNNLDIDQIAQNLYQGSNPPHGTALADAGFDVLVLCACERQYAPENYPGLKRVIYAPMDDTDVVPKAMARSAAQKVVRELRAGSKVLVVCNMGLNRSGLVNALALHYLTGQSGASAMQTVQSRRQSALFNPAFALYLYHLMPRERLQTAA